MLDLHFGEAAIETSVEMIKKTKTSIDLGSSPKLEENPKVTRLSGFRSPNGYFNSNIRND